MFILLTVAICDIFVSKSCTGYRICIDFIWKGKITIEVLSLSKIGSMFTLCKEFFTDITGVRNEVFILP